MPTPARRLHAPRPPRSTVAGPSPEGVADPSARTRHVPALVVLATAAFAAITTEMLPVGVLPQVARSLHVSQSSAGLLVSAYALMVITTSVPLAALVARWPRRDVLVVLLAVYAAGNLLLAAAPHYWLAVVARVLAGVAHAGFYSVVFLAAVDLVPRERATGAIVIVNAGNALARTVGVPAGTAVATAAGWRWSFTGAGVLMAVLAAAVAVLVPRTSAPATQGAVSVWAAVRQRPLLQVSLVILLATLGTYTLLTYISALLLHTGAGEDVLSVALLAYGVGGLLGLPAAGALTRRFPRAGTPASISANAACLLALALLTGTGASPAASIAVIGAWGFAFSVLGTALQVAAVHAAPDGGDAAPAMTNTSWNIGIAGGALIGSRELLLTTPPVLALTAAALVLAALAVSATTVRAAGDTSLGSTTTPPAATETQD